MEATDLHEPTCCHRQEKFGGQTNTDLHVLKKMPVKRIKHLYA